GIGPPGMSGEITPYHHLNLERNAFPANGNIGCRHIQKPVWTDVAALIQHDGRNLVQHLALEGNLPRKNDVEGRNSVGRNHHQQVFAYRIDITHLAAVVTRLAGELKCSHAPKVKRVTKLPNSGHPKISTFYPFCLK